MSDDRNGIIDNPRNEQQRKTEQDAQRVPKKNGFRDCESSIRGRDDELTSLIESEVAITIKEKAK